jgi:hypothetical protein
VALSPSAVACSGDGCCQGIYTADANVFKGDDHEPPPDRCAFEFEERQRGTLRDIGLAAANGFLKQTADDPWISGDRLFCQGRVGIDLAGEPVLGCAKCVAHDVSENLMCKKTLAFGRPKASEMRLTRKKNRRGDWNKRENVQRHRKLVGLRNIDITC